MSTTVVYASGQSGDIWCADATYLNAARGDGSFSVYSAEIAPRVGQYEASGTYRATQTFLKWDTSAVGTDTVSNVDFEADGDGDYTAVDFTIEGYAYDWGTTLEEADFRDSDAGIPALGTIISSYDTSGGWDSGTGYNNDLGATTDFNSAINGSGDTRIVLLSQEHRNESAPGVGSGNYEWVILQGPGATNPARLTITHAAAGPTLTYLAPDADVAATGWATAPLWSKVDDDPASADGTVITGAST